MNLRHANSEDVLALQLDLNAQRGTKVRTIAVQAVEVFSIPAASWRAALWASNQCLEWSGGRPEHREWISVLDLLTERCSY